MDTNHIKGCGNEGTTNAQVLLLMDLKKENVV
jgi:hypothetical protein